MSRRCSTNGHLPDIAPALLASVELPDGRRAKTVFSLISERYLDERYAPESVAAECGVAAATITRIAHEIAHVAFNEAVELPIRWTDMHGRTHDKVIGRPVAMHAMRGISAHSNGFQTCRALHLMQMLLGALEGPGNFRARAPYPRRIPHAHAARERSDGDLRARHAAEADAQRQSDAARGSGHRQGRQAAAHRPGVLMGIAARRARPDAHGDHQRRQPRSLPDRHAAAVHGEHGVEFVDEHRRTCARCWRARQRTANTRYRSSSSSTRSSPRPCNFADLVLPDTTYLERYDAISLLDRPISEPDAAADAIRHPILKPDRDVGRGRTCWSSSRRGSSFRRSRARTARASSPTTATSSSITRNFPASAFSPAGAARTANRICAASRIPKQWEKYIEHQSFFTYPWPENMRYYRFANKDYLEFAEKHALFGTPPVQVILQMYSEPLQKFRLAGQGLYDGPQPTVADRPRAAGHLLRSAAVLVRAAGNRKARRAKRIHSTRSRSGR